MLELYHGYTSVCAQKVRLVLAEKGLEWNSHVMLLNGDHLEPDYLKLNPNGVVPTLVHDGNVIVESNVIMHYLDDFFSKSFRSEQMEERQFSLQSFNELS